MKISAFEEHYTLPAIADAALWVAVAIGVAALATSLILKPRTAESGLSH